MALTLLNMNALLIITEYILNINNTYISYLYIIYTGIHVYCVMTFGSIYTRSKVHFEA